MDKDIEAELRVKLQALIGALFADQRMLPTRRKICSASELNIAPVERELGIRIELM